MRRPRAGVRDDRGCGRVGRRSPATLHEPVARVTVVVDAVLALQRLDVPKVGLRVRAGHAVAEWLERVQERLLETAAHAHSLVRGQLGQGGRETALESDGDVHALDLERRLPARNAVPEGERVSVQVPDRVVAQLPRTIAGGLDDRYVARPVERVQLVRVADDEIQRAPLRRRRARLEEELGLAEVDASHGGGLAPAERVAEAQPIGVELDRGREVGDAQGCMVPLDVDARCRYRFHGVCLSGTKCARREADARRPASRRRAPGTADASCGRPPELSCEAAHAEPRVECADGAAPAATTR
ncbi:MAG: hypothetical protein AVDCRST_MAG11-1231 [uncultured Gemmatimonadaceae bacterium]|uniref:Uncharacterized protein n=1 Tax=uncultured Gemmatimonadaceae bacterium TaxID=246130 RepID=A0A6J4KKA0_9BACT|nr:MAG: hypothetical protein AVDCRST_MAG11-1231 [uncultured Gemmatimonadaceae bacterium]